MTTSIDAPAARPVPEGDGPSAVPVLAEGVELLGELPGSGYRQAPSLVRRGDGQTLQLTPLLYGVLAEVDGKRDYAAIAPELSERIGKTASAEDVRFLVEKKLQPLGVLERADGSQPVTAKANPLLALRPRVVLSDPNSTRRITGPFARLFAPVVVAFMLLAFVVTTGWVLFEKGLGSATHQAFYEPGLLLTVFALTVLSAGFHEFGHAAACRRGGATPGTMGFGLYIVFPAFYTDVSDSYRLDRRRRLMVDLGGLYFNAVFGVAAFAVWAVTRWDALLLVIGLQVLQMLRQLTPVIRADGYHILADITGVPDLFAHLGPTIKSLWPGNWGKRDSRTLKRWARVLVVAWTALIVPSLAFALFSGAVLLPRLIATAWDSLGVQWDALTGGLGDGDVLAGLLAVLKMVAVVLPVAGIILLLGRLAWRTVRKAWTWSGSSRRRRAVALVALAAVVAGLAWCWWPRDQYVPVQGNERGTVLELAGVLQAASTGTLRPVATAEVRRPAAPVRTSALLLVPRAGQGDGTRPALMLLRPEAGGAPQIVAIPPRTDVPPTAQPSPGPEAGETPEANPWPFPFPPPQEQREGDNRAMAVNTTDGTALYDVSFAVVWVSGDDVLQRNEAIALANCTNCRTVAVSFQTIFILGQSDTVVPINTSLAVNSDCVSCSTTAIAVQLVATLTALPDPAVMAELDAIWVQLDKLADEIPTLTDQEIYNRLKGVEAAILTTLDRAGTTIVDSAEAAGGPTGSEAQPAATPSPQATDTESGSAEASPSPAPGSGTADGSTDGTSGSADGSGSSGSDDPVDGTDTSDADTDAEGGSDPSPAPSPSASPSAAPAESGSSGSTTG